MAKSKYNQDKVFENFMGTNAAKEESEAVKDNSQDPSDAKQEMQTETQKTETKRQPEGKTTGHIQRAYWITKELDRAIKLKGAYEDMDNSEVVRAALKRYLADIIEREKLNG
jgi:N12 class adenine-specific DNA methylase